MTIRLVTFNKEIYGVAVARDITERKRAEKVLLENSLMLRDMQLARQIQLSLLPAAPPELPGACWRGSVFRLPTWEGTITTITGERTGQSTWSSPMSPGTVSARP